MATKFGKMWNTLPVWHIAWSNFEASVDLVLAKGFELQAVAQAQGAALSELSKVNHAQTYYSKFLADTFTFTHLFQALLIIGLWHIAWLELVPATVLLSLTLVAPVLAKYATIFMQRINIEIHGALDVDSARQEPERSLRTWLATVFIGIPLLAHNVIMIALFIPYALSVKTFGLVLASAADIALTLCCCYAKSSDGALPMQQDLGVTSSLSGQTGKLRAVAQDDGALALQSPARRNQRDLGGRKQRFSYTPNPASGVGSVEPPPLALGSAQSAQDALPAGQQAESLLTPDSYKLAHA